MYPLTEALITSLRWMQIRADHLWPPLWEYAWKAAWVAALYGGQFEHDVGDSRTQGSLHQGHLQVLSEGRVKLIRKTGWYSRVF
jgi:hypothetical protein